MLLITAPPGHEKYFDELRDLIAKGGKPDPVDPWRVKGWPQTTRRGSGGTAPLLAPEPSA
jgi:hypothetical protein